MTELHRLLAVLTSPGVGQEGQPLVLGLTWGHLCASVHCLHPHPPHLSQDSFGNCSQMAVGNLVLFGTKHPSPKLRESENTGNPLSVGKYPEGGFKSQWCHSASICLQKATVGLTALVVSAPLPQSLSLSLPVA